MNDENKTSDRLANELVELRRRVAESEAAETERKRAAEERELLLTQIRAQATQMQQTMDTVPEGVLLLDAKGRVILANPVAEGDLAALADAKVGDTLAQWSLP